jgi:hypothetical protein
VEQPGSKPGFYFERKTEMPEMTREKTSDKTLVQLKLPPGLVHDVDRLAAEEMITRTAWIRRLLLGATRKAKCDAL